MPRFSERIGIVLPKAIQVDEIDAALRASLWNVSRSWCFSGTGTSTNRATAGLPARLYADFYKKPVDLVPSYQSQYVAAQMKFFLEGSWYRVYDLVEFLHNYLAETEVSQGQNSRRYAREINVVLEREKSGYRFIGGTLAPIVDPVEIGSLERGMEHSGRFAGVGEHLKTALALYALKPTPDYRNSVKESISSVEAAACILAGNSSATLGEALKIIHSSKPIHEAMRKSMMQLYGYTSDEGGVRHSMLEDKANVDEADALYMLVACSAFSNFLIYRSGA